MPSGALENFTGEWKKRRLFVSVGKSVTGKCLLVKDSTMGFLGSILS